MVSDSYLLGYLLVVNTAAFIAYGVDKHRARKKQWRIPESRLLLMAFAGGALGAWIGMRMFRHKTQHWKFRVLVPLFLLLWLAGLGWMTCK